MTQLRETVAVVTPAGRLTGHLFVGTDGLPEVLVKYPGDAMCPYTGPLRYRPAIFPAAWRLSSPTCGELYQAWLDVERIQRQLAVAQREAEQETPEPEDELTAYKRHRALEDE